MPLKQVLTLEMFLDWREHPVTEVLVSALRRRRQQLHEEWEQGNYACSTNEATLAKNAEALGKLGVICWLLQLDHETLKGEVDEDRDSEPIWITAPRKGGAGSNDTAG